MNMENELRGYIESQFAGSQPSRANIELKEELYQNLLERYRDIINEGKDPQSAYNIAVASMGSITPLITGPSPMEQAAVQAARKRSAVLVAISIMLYILCPVPLIVFATMGQPIIGLTLLFVFVAVATGVIIFNNMTKSSAVSGGGSDTTVEEFRTWQNQNNESRRMYKAISQCLWSLTVVIYLAVSFLTTAWHITWIIFLISAAIDGIVKAMFELRKQG